MNLTVYEYILLPFGGNRLLGRSGLAGRNTQYCCVSGLAEKGGRILDANPALLEEQGGRPHSWIGALVNQANTLEEVNCRIRPVNEM